MVRLVSLAHHWPQHEVPFSCFKNVHIIFPFDERAYYNSDHLKTIPFLWESSGMDIKEQIRQTLDEHFQPFFLEINDESDRHAGHQGAKESGGGHFEVMIVSEKFSSLKSINRHRLVYQFLKPLEKFIHALKLRTLSPQEWQNLGP